MLRPIERAQIAPIYNGGKAHVTCVDVIGQVLSGEVDQFFDERSGNEKNTLFFIKTSKFSVEAGCS